MPRVWAWRRPRVWARRRRFRAAGELLRCQGAASELLNELLGELLNELLASCWYWWRAAGELPSELLANR